MNKIRLSVLVLGIAIVLGAWTSFQGSHPVIYLVGDSTVKNGQGKGDGGLWGWGNFLQSYFDSTKITVENDAMGGRSSRTFQTEGLWDKVVSKLKPGDYVFIQFGHNDGGSLNTGRARASLKGIGTESQDVVLEANKKHEIVYTYGWYLRKYISETRSKGAIPVVCSSVPRNDWDNGRIKSDTVGYALWASQVAKMEGVFFVDLNGIISKHYNELGESFVRANLFNDKDHTHTILAGAKFNAGCVIEGLKKLEGFGLNNCMVKK